MTTSIHQARSKPVTAPGAATGRRGKLGRVAAIVAMLAVIGWVVSYQSTFVGDLTIDPFFVGYALLVTTYILSRFGIVALYRPARDSGMEPTVAMIVAGFNEQEEIAATMQAILKADYPHDKLDVIVVNDGSTDGTLHEMMAVAAKDARVKVINFRANRGKREAMAAGFAMTTSEIVAFVDSDSRVEPDAIRQIVQPFANPRVGAVCGHGEVQNVGATWMTRMQAVRYFVAFRVIKAAESIFGAVTCCSGCFSAYRRDAIAPVIDEWLNQRFLGRRCTYGDDRSLTNHVLKRWRVVYQSTARVGTAVPETFRQFMRQQLRWKRSWTRESPLLAAFVWKKNVVASLFAYIGIVLTLVSPVVAVRAMAWRPLVEGSGAPMMYLIGMTAMALVYGLYYASRQGLGDGLWVYGLMFVFFYLAFLVWQTYWAVLTSRSTSWGTRASTHQVGTAAADIFRPGLPIPAPLQEQRAA